MADAGSHRLDNFTDAAFAFAVTLLVIGSGAVPARYDELRASIAGVPAFAMSFALIAMFWHAHVRWRRLCGRDDALSVTLTLALVFLVLVYVYPLRLIATSTIAWVSGDSAQLMRVVGGGQRELFTIYGAGFVAMAGVVAGLFAAGRRTTELTQAARAEVIGEIDAWRVLIAVGLVSILLAQSEQTGAFAGMAYASIPLLVLLSNWRRKRQASRIGNRAG